MKQLMLLTTVASSFLQLAICFKLKNAYQLSSNLQNGDFVADADGNLHAIARTLAGQLLFFCFNQTVTTASPSPITVPVPFFTSKIFFSSSNKNQLIVSLNANGGAPAGQAVNMGLDLSGKLLWNQSWSSAQNDIFIANEKDEPIYSGVVFDGERGVLLRLGEAGNILWSMATNYSNYYMWSATVNSYSEIGYIILTGAVASVRPLLTVNFRTGELLADPEFRCDPAMYFGRIQFAGDAVYLFCAQMLTSYQIIRIDASGAHNSTAVLSGNLLDAAVSDNCIVLVVSFVSINKFCLVRYDLRLLNSTSVCRTDFQPFQLQIAGNFLYLLALPSVNLLWDGILVRKSWNILKFELPVKPDQRRPTSTARIVVSPTRNQVAIDVQATSLSQTGLILVCILPTIILAISLVTTLVIKKRRRTGHAAAAACTSMSSTSQDYTQLNTVTPLSVPGYLLVKKHEYMAGKQLYSGGAGSVHLVQILSDELKSRVKHGDQVVAKVPFDASIQARDRILLEIAVLHYLNQRSNYFAHLIGFEEKTVTMLMLFYRHGSLKNFINAPEWTKRHATLIPLDIAHGLAEMHQLGLAHCDIKLDNILIDFDSARGRYVAVIADLGIARVVTDRTRGVQALNADWSLGLSLRYAAPEILALYKFKVPDERSPGDIFEGDVYAFGVVLYQCATRQSMVWAQPE